MDRRAEFRFTNTRKLESYVEMAGMTIYRHPDTHRITDISYLDYEFGDPEQAWEARAEKFPADPDEERLPDRSKDRFCISYWRRVGGPYRHCGAHYKTDEDLRKEAEAVSEEILAEQRAKRVIAARKAAETRAENKRQHEIYRKRMATRDANKAAKKAQMVADSLSESDRWRNLERVRQEEKRAEAARANRKEKDYQDLCARRARQAVAMEKRFEFSSPQRCHGVTWADPLITDIRLVRVVLGPNFVNYVTREMTVEEQADYWYWKARGVTLDEPLRREMP